MASALGLMPSMLDKRDQGNQFHTGKRRVVVNVQRSKYNLQLHGILQYITLHIYYIYIYIFAIYFTIGEDQWYVTSNFTSATMLGHGLAIRGTGG